MGDWFKKFMSLFGSASDEYTPQLNGGDSYKDAIIIDKSK
jgi:hypothetical protein